MQKIIATLILVLLIVGSMWLGSFIFKTYLKPDIDNYKQKLNDER